ncbi:MAG: hypothetical protein Q7T10_01905 [Rhodoferax sp.]|nr:hypothetical protein [Rhodoferax sp.]
MGSLLAGVCYPSLDLAKSVFCSNLHISVATSSSVTTEYYCWGVVGPYGPEGYSMSAYQNGVWSGDSVGDYPGFVDCNFDAGTSLSMEYFALFLGFLVVVAVASRLKRIFWGNHEGL